LLIGYIGLVQDKSTFNYDYIESFVCVYKYEILPFKNYFFAVVFCIVDGCEA